MLILLFMLMFGRGDLATRDTVVVDVIELNHFHRKDGDHGFDQVILWRVEPATGKLQSVGWRLWYQGPDQIQSVGKRVKIIGSPDGRPMTAYLAPIFRETWSQTDPEKEAAMHRWGGTLGVNLFLPAHRAPDPDTEEAPYTIEVR